MLAALGRTVAVGLRQQLAPAKGGAPPLPGVELRRQVPPLPRALIDDYLRFLGSDPRAYRGVIPPHLFPQWCFPTLGRTLEGQPYPLLRVVNGGCRISVAAPLPDDEPLEVRAQLMSVDDDGRRAVFHQRAVTGTASCPDALRIDLYPIVVHGRAKSDHPTPANSPKTASKKDHSRVPEDARELLRLRLPADAGLSYAKLSGDFNPIHWLPPYAKASGFRSVILHGFASLAFSWEGLIRNLFGGDARALATLDVKLKRPLPLPHDIGLYVWGDALFLGDARCAPAYLVGTMERAAPPVLA